MANNFDDNVLQLDTNEDDIFDSLSDNSQLNKESVFLKFFGTEPNKIENYLPDIRGLLANNNIMIKGLFFKGIYSLLIEVTFTDSFRNWLISLIEVRNNIRTLSDKARKNILKSAFGKFNFVFSGQITHMNVIPNVKPQLVKCKSFNYPFGLFNGDIFNIVASKIHDNCETLIDNFVSERASNNFLNKISGLRIEPVGNELSLRFLIKKEHINNLLLKSLNSSFGALSFCSSTIHFVPATYEEKLQNSVQVISNTIDFWDKLSEIDILLSDTSEQALAMSRNPQANRKRLSSIIVQPNEMQNTSSNSGNIFSRLGPPVSKQRSHPASLN